MDNGDETQVIERTEKGQFPEGKSGNPVGRPKGSKNKVTLLKLMAEEAVRSRNEDRMLEVANRVIEEALDGDFRCQKLVWDAIMSKGSVDDRTTAHEKVQINIGPMPSKEEKVVEAVNPNQEEAIDGTS